MKKTSIRVSVAFVLLAGAMIAPSAAQAGLLDDFLKNLIRPFTTRVETPSSTEVKEGGKGVVSSAPLYKPAYDYERAVIDAVKKASPAVVSITVSKNVPIIEQCPGTFGNIPPEFQQFFGALPQFTVPCERGTRLQEVGGGSGFVVSPDGLILTNKHVVDDRKASYTVFTNDGKKYDAKVLARDPVQDLAVMKIDVVDFPTVELGDSSSIELGQTAIAIGNALGEFRNTVSVGVVSGLARTVTAGNGTMSETIQGVIQTDTAINPGNSGGPLLNLRGQVIGVNTAMAAGAQSIGFAIPINRAKRDIESVKRGGTIEAAYLGVRYLLLMPEMAKEQKLSVDHGALVRGGADGPAIMADSPAAKAGIQAEDVITEFGGKRVDRETPLASLLVEYKPGDTVSVKVSRGGKEVVLSVVLGVRPGN